MFGTQVTSEASRSTAKELHKQTAGKRTADRSMKAHDDDNPLLTRHPYSRLAATLATAVKTVVRLVHCLTSADFLSVM